jgi:beta-ureidopropionase / N-carbamoyl-L-amino-acid hydrolase
VIDGESLRVDGARLWRRIEEMAEIGATERGGCNRQALTDGDRQGRDLFVSWARQLGCDVTVDRIGNLIARRSGTDDGLPPVLMGSHLDTQPTGGRFDGVYGVLAGLEIIEVLNRAAVDTRHSIELAVWTNEEGARFSPAMLGSGVWTGTFALDAVLQAADRDGVTVRTALDAIGYAGPVAASAHPLRAAFELHIEQGPILERAGLQIGVVTGVQGIRWYDLGLTGTPAHAGPTPMDLRQDPFQALSLVLPEIYGLATSRPPWGRATVGNVVAVPGVRNTIPERVDISVDLRHPDEATLDVMEAELRAVVGRAEKATGVTATLTENFRSDAVRFSDACVSSIRTAADHLGVITAELVSGAGHDSVHLARIAPTGMIFIPCRGGISHNELESAEPADVTLGADILLGAVLDQADVVGSSSS